MDDDYDRIQQKLRKDRGIQSNAKTYEGNFDDDLIQKKLRSASGIHTGAKSYDEDLDEDRIQQKLRSDGDVQSMQSYAKSFDGSLDEDRIQQKLRRDNDIRANLLNDEDSNVDRIQKKLRGDRGLPSNSSSDDGSLNEDRIQKKLRSDKSIQSEFSSTVGDLDEDRIQTKLRSDRNMQNITANNFERRDLVAGGEDRIQQKLRTFNETIPPKIDEGDEDEDHNNSQSKIRSSGSVASELIRSLRRVGSSQASEPSDAASYMENGSFERLNSSNGSGLTARDSSTSQPSSSLEHPTRSSNSRGIGKGDPQDSSFKINYIASNLRQFISPGPMESCMSSVQRNIIKFSLVAVLLILAVSIPIFVLSSNKPEDNNSFNKKIFKNLLISENIANATDLDDSRTPQSKAFTWTSERNILQTSLYVLATITYGLAGTSGDPLTLLEDDDEWCQWSWIGCTDNNEITSVTLDDKNLDGTILSEIQRLTYLKELNLPKNDFTGTIPEELGSLTLLERLDLSSNLFTGVIPDDIWKLVYLKMLKLEYNIKLNGTLPRSISATTSLEVLDIKACDVDGSLPTEIGGLPNLKSIYLGNNQNFGGTIPTEIGQMGSLEDLKLDGNNISGNIPTEIGNATSLKSFVLSKNNLQESIPSTIGNLVDLEVFEVNSNAITGIIPTEFGKLSKLQVFQIEKTQITGIIPAEMENLTELSEVTTCSVKVKDLPRQWCKISGIEMRVQECPDNCADVCSDC